MATGTKLSSTVERDETAVSSGLRKDEHHTWRPNKSDHVISPPSERNKLVEHLAYEYWEERGRPDGSPEEDWFRAEAMLRKDSDR